MRVRASRQRPHETRVVATDPVGSRMVEVLGAVTPRLDPAPARAVIAPGSLVAWDDCCDGQVAVRVVQMSPIGSSSAVGFCLTGWNVTLGISVVRCAATVDDNGVPPSSAQITADGLQMTKDLTAIEQALRCSGLVSGFVGWMPLGPEGGCTGGEWQVSTIVMACEPCPPETPEEG